MFTCVIHYGGDFVLSLRMKYTSKSEACFDFVDASRFSTFSLCDMVQNLGLVRPFAVYWRVPEAALSTASIRPLKTDHDYITMLNNMPSNRYIHIYLKPFEKEVHEEEKEEHVAQEEENHENEEEEDHGTDEEYYDAAEEHVHHVEEVVAEEEQNQDDEEEQNNTTLEDENIIIEEEESGVVAEEESGAEEEDIVVEEEESATEEEEDYAVEEEEFAAESFDVSDNEYDCGRDEGCRQKDGIGIRVQRNMDGFGSNGVHVNDKDHGPESETDKSEELYSEHGSDSDGPRRFSIDVTILQLIYEVYQLRN
ncbi:hypothetical protein V6N12_034639 [Hibiscus sabdariffa]|uniref:PB1-like domain-containing protein n=1 Tax=Hibiscus sabdariffa TaxID=183260 RepID=A0ABR2DHS9_9ROSI